MLATADATRFVVQFRKNYNIESFVAHYYKSNPNMNVAALSQVGVEPFSIGSFKGVVGDFDVSFVKNLYNDDNIGAISLDRELVLAEVQENAPMHLARVSQQQKLRQGQSMDYLYDPSGGIGVDVYILDSGIESTVAEYNHRVTKIADYTKEGANTIPHGTYVAGVVASETYGVAKKANLFDVKVTDKNGRTKLSSVVSALNLISQDSKITKRPTLIVIPLIMKKNAVLNGAVEAVVNEGIPVIVSAGNDGKDACDYSPASAKGSLTAGSVDYQDQIAPFSNWGSCVDVFASGVKVETTGTNGTVAKSGTSLSAGLAGGMVAYFMGMGDNGTQAVERLVKYSITGAIPEDNLLSRPSTSSRILFNGEGEPNWGPKMGIP
ncbi:Subtilase-type proteinase RRT12 [Cyberlindnera fabianii]|nr:Subtilase-type proteinase RRT12 [Cyberlindnera fabianii]